MKVIKKRISLEQFKSRIPTFIDSFDDVDSYMASTDGARFVDFNITGKEEKIIAYYPMANYNLYPCDVKLETNLVNSSKIDKSLLKSIYSTSTITKYGDVAYSNDYCTTPTFQYYAISYGVLKKIYHFFVTYNKLLYDANKCGHLISSATQYWEIFDKQYTNQTYYEELDTTFKKYGGKVTIGKNEEGYDAPIIGEMDDYVVNTIFKTFKIPQDYVKYWHTDILYPIDAIKWKNWFAERDIIYDKGDVECNEIEKIVSNCNDDIVIQKYDCEDCEMYKRLGGYTMSTKLSNFVNSLGDIVTSSASTSIDIDLFIPNSIDDMGEFTILSEDWVGGINYSNDSSCSNSLHIDKCNTKKNFSGGTTVTYDNDVWILTDCGKSGFTVNNCDTYEFQKEAWTKYFEVKKDDITIKQPNTNIYAYDSNYIIHVSSTSSVTSDFVNDVAIKLEYHTNNGYGYIVYNDEPIPLTHTKYVEFRNDYYFVKNDFKGEYIYYKNKKYYLNDDNTVTIDKIPYISNGLILNVKDASDFIILNNKINKIRSGNLFVIDDYIYPVIDGYFYHNTHYYYVKNNVIVYYSIFYDYVENLHSIDTFGTYIIDTTKVTENTLGYSFKDNQIVLYQPFEVYSNNILTGTSQSQLSTLRTQNVACDDMGFELLGYFEIKEDSLFVQPKENTVLDLYYHVNNVARLTQISETEDEFILWGDLLEDMIFYYKDNKNNITSDKFSVKKFNGNNLLTIEETTNNWCLKKKDNFDRDYSIYKNITDTLCCDFVYYVGAILKRGKNDIEYKLYQPNTAFDGIKYEEECKLTITQQDFHIDSKNVYKVYYYDIEHKTKQTKYDDTVKDIEQAYFKTILNYDTEIDSDNLSFSQMNALTYSPIFKEEYKFGSSMKENILDTIYIERAIIKPTEKNLQLIDVLTLESLEEYGNGKIKILKNS